MTFYVTTSHNRVSVIYLFLGSELKTYVYTTLRVTVVYDILQFIF